MASQHFIYIDYEEFDQDSYRGVEVIAIDDTHKRFASGDPVADFEAAINWIGETYPEGTMIAYSSSVDAFLSDGKKYRYDENNMIKPARQYRAKG